MVAVAYTIINPARNNHRSETKKKRSFRVEIEYNKNVNDNSRERVIEPIWETHSKSQAVSSKLQPYSICSLHHYSAHTLGRRRKEALWRKNIEAIPPNSVRMYYMYIVLQRVTACGASIESKKERKEGERGSVDSYVSRELESNSRLKQSYRLRR
jgi:hypothetical protein